MEQRTLGQGLVVSAIGIGCMPLTGASYGDVDEREAIATLHQAFDAGVTLLDTAEVYGPEYGNEILVGKAISGRRDEVVVSTKVGSYFDPKSGDAIQDSRPETIRRSCEGSLRRLGVDVIDLYYQHRVDTTLPIEESWGAMSELVIAGKVRYLGMSEPGLNTLRRAHAVHPVAAVENEYSLFTRDPEGPVLDTLRELSIGLVAYAPLARGFLSGKFRDPADLAPNDLRLRVPRFQGDDFHKNLKLVDQIETLAAAKGVTTIQFALAWLLAQGQDIVPIPGIVSRPMLDEDVAAVSITLTDAELRAVDEIVPKGASGIRHQPIEKNIRAESP